MKLRKLLLMFMILLIVVPLASAVNVAFSCSAVSSTQVDCTFSYAGNIPGATPPPANFDTGWAVSLNVNSGSYALAQSNFQNNPASSTLLYNSAGNPQVNMISTADLGPSGNLFVLRFTGVTTGSNTIVLNNIQLFDEDSNPVPGTTSTLSSTVTVVAAPSPSCTSRPPTPCVDGITCLSGTPSPSPRTGCPAGQTCQSGSCQAVPPSPCASATWDCSKKVDSCAGVTVGDTLEFRQHLDCDHSNSACLSDPARPASFVLCPKSGPGAPTAAERLVGHMKSIAEGLQYPVDGSTVSPGTPNSATVVYNYKTLEDNPSTAILRKTAALARAIFGALTAT